MHHAHITGEEFGAPTNTIFAINCNDMFLPLYKTLVKMQWLRPVLRTQDSKMDIFATQPVLSEVQVSVKHSDCASTKSYGTYT